VLRCGGIFLVVFLSHESHEKDRLVEALQLVWERVLVLFVPAHGIHGPDRNRKKLGKKNLFTPPEFRDSVIIL